MALRSVVEFGAVLASPLFLASPLSAQWVFDPAATPPGLAPASGAGTGRLVPAPEQTGARVTIVESQSYNSGHSMDDDWVAVSLAEGFVPAIVPQAALDSLVFIGNTDILVISSGVIGISATRAANIRTFLMAGGAIYLQGEYQASYSPNQLFASLVQQDGGTFVWGTTQVGDQSPVNVLGFWGQAPYVTGPVTGYWYGCTVASRGPRVEPMLDSSGVELGWFFLATSGGRLVHNTDQDWVNQARNTNLMANILFTLSSSTARPLPGCQGALGYTVNPGPTGGTWALDVNGNPGALFAIFWSNDSTPVPVLGQTACLGTTFFDTYVGQLPGSGQFIVSQSIPANLSGATLFSQAASITVPRILDVSQAWRVFFR